MNNHTTFFVLPYTASTHIYVRVHQTEWEGRQRIPIVGSRMEKRSKHAHSYQGLGRAFTNKKKKKTKDERSCTHQQMAQIFSYNYSDFYFHTNSLAPICTKDYTFIV